MPRAGQVKSRSGDRLTDRVGVGVLTRSFPPQVIDEVVAAQGRTEQRKRLLPARLVVYYVMALALFASEGTANSADLSKWGSRPATHTRGRPS